MKRLAALLLAGVSFSASAALDYVPGSAEDPHVRSAKFLSGNRQYFSAISELLKVQKAGGEQFEAAPEFWAGLGEDYLSFGMHDRAETIYRTVAASSADPLASGRARLRLAEYEFQRGYGDEARANLLRAREKLPEKLEPEWQDVYSRVLLSQGRFAEAIALLDKVDSAADPTGYMRYNLGVGLITSGQVAQGRTVLDRIGRLTGKSQEVMALRDKANVTLGWHFLQNRLGGSAKPVLERVRSEGIFSNRALLGVGWAEIAPEGRRQSRTGVGEDERNARLNDPFRNFSALGVLIRRGYVDDPYERADVRNFRRSNLGKNEEEAARRALVPWLQLIDRDPQDPAVQESWLAIPFALDMLGAHTQAVTYYEQAADRLEEARKRTSAALDYINTGRMVETLVLRDVDLESGWMWEARDLPDAPETYYLQSLIAEHRFAEVLKNYRDVRMLQNVVEGWRARIDRMDSAYKSVERPPFDPRVAFALAKRNWKPTRENLNLNLREETVLAAPGTYNRPPPVMDMKGPQLKLSSIPAKFDGSWERLQSLKKRTDSLKTALQAAGADAQRQLQKMALDELKAQKSQIEKYLVEVRFSLARVYDRALPEEDQDEVDVDKSGKPLGTKLPRGEYDIDKSAPVGDQINKKKPVTRGRPATQDEHEIK